MASDAECPRLTFIGVPERYLGVTSDRRYVKDQAVVNMCVEWCKHKKCWLDCNVKERLWEEWDVYFNEEEKAQRTIKRSRREGDNKRL